MIKLTYITRVRKEKLFSLDEIREFGRRYDYPMVMNIADRLIRNPEAVLTDTERLVLERALEIDQDKLGLESPGDYFEVELT